MTFLLFYNDLDFLGIVKSQAKKLYGMVEKALQEACRELKTGGIVGNKTTPPILKFYNSGDEEMDKLSNETQKPDEAISQQQSLPIYFCCEKDCKSGIVNAARNLFEKKANAKPTLSLPEALFNKDLDAATLNSAINKQIGWPESEPNSEPDLMMVFGNIKSTLGKFYEIECKFTGSDFNLEILNIYVYIYT